LVATATAAEAPSAALVSLPMGGFAGDDDDDGDIDWERYDFTRFTKDDPSEAGSSSFSDLKSLHCSSFPKL
jgi:hypothetical protein